MSENKMTLSQTGIVMAQVTAKQMKEAVQVYQSLVQELLDETDIVAIQGKKYIKKSGWLKLAVPFNITTEILEENQEMIEDGKYFAYHVKVRARAQNGRYVDELGSCDNTSADKKDASRHIVRTMAKTRATSRAIAGLIGASEQSAEDMEVKKDTSDSVGACKCPEGPDCKENSRTCQRCGKQDLS